MCVLGLSNCKSSTECDDDMRWHILHYNPCQFPVVVVTSSSSLACPVVCGHRYSIFVLAPPSILLCLLRRAESHY